MILADSNLIIYAASGHYPALVEWFTENRVVVSAVTLVEVLGYHQLDSQEKKTLAALFSDLGIVYPDETVFHKAVELRQQHAMSLGDALIAATALQGQYTLATHNVADFTWVKSLEVVDPISG